MVQTPETDKVYHRVFYNALFYLEFFAKLYISCFDTVCSKTAFPEATMVLLKWIQSKSFIY